MQVVLRQTFPLGRFHATPWRTNPFDDPHGEWPPSPWRMVRGVVARWHQWCREDPTGANGMLDALIRALCSSSYSFHLPIHAQRGPSLRQYFPVEFGWNPKDKEKDALRSYSTSLAQDNYVCLPPHDDGAVWWLLEGDLWDEKLTSALDECLRRMTYFGRAESFTHIAVAKGPAKVPACNCKMTEQRTLGAVPVLVPEATATREDVERVTDDPQAAKRSVPTGARMMYATRPKPPTVKEIPLRHMHSQQTNLMQFAIGWNVPPEPRAVVRLTARFRGAVIKELLTAVTGDDSMTWNSAPMDVRKQVELMSGKDAEGKPIPGHIHSEFLMWGEQGALARLLAWREGQPFTKDESEAMLRAAERQYSWASPGSNSDVWTIRLIPLDRAVPEPPGFGELASESWESVTPYVPPRHHLRGGHLREKESIDSQIRRELGLRGFREDDLSVVEVLGKPEWVAVHVPERQRAQRAFVGDRLGYRIRLRFATAVHGPIRLGHSSSFGLGLFTPSL